MSQFCAVLLSPEHRNKRATLAKAFPVSLSPSPTPLLNGKSTCLDQRYECCGNSSICVDEPSACRRVVQEGIVVLNCCDHPMSGALQARAVVSFVPQTPQTLR